MVRTAAVVLVAASVVIVSAASATDYPRISVGYFSKNAIELARERTSLEIVGHVEGGGRILEDDAGHQVKVNYEFASPEIIQKLKNCLFGGLGGTCDATVRGRAEMCHATGELTSGDYPCFAVGEE